MHPIFYISLLWDAATANGPNHWRCLEAGSVAIDYEGKQHHEVEKVVAEKGPYL